MNTMDMANFIMLLYITWSLFGYIGFADWIHHTNEFSMKDLFYRTLFCGPLVMIINLCIILVFLHNKYIVK